MPSGIGDRLFRLITASPTLHRLISNRLIATYADGGPLPGLYTTQGRGQTRLRELLGRKFFALEVPTPEEEDLEGMPDIEALVDLMVRDGPMQPSRVSVLLPFFAQHLTDAVFQSDGQYGTNATHEIILNQIYGNTEADETALRTGVDGKLRTQTREVNGGAAAFPDALFERQGDGWAVKPRYGGLSYLTPERTQSLLEKYAGREGDVCATGLFQGNLTLGNFAITTLMVREHNRICDGVLAERRERELDTGDDVIFGLAQQINITTYMKVVLEDYINAFAGQRIFKLDTESFFHEKKRWCRETPLPYHFNILYRIHAMLPDSLPGLEDQGFAGMLANNDKVMEMGLGAVFESASRQPAAAVRLGNTHPKLRPAEVAGLTKARGVLGFFNAHKEAHERGSRVNFNAFDPAYRETLRELYEGDVNRVDYAVGILAELPRTGWQEKLGLKDPPIIGPTLMNAIAKHAFRHILSNRYLTREFLDRKVMGDFGWRTLQETRGVSDILKRNLQGEMDAEAAGKLKIGFHNPDS